MAIVEETAKIVEEKIKQLANEEYEGERSASRAAVDFARIVLRELLLVGGTTPDVVGAEDPLNSSGVYFEWFQTPHRRHVTIWFDSKQTTIHRIWIDGQKQEPPQMNVHNAIKQIRDFMLLTVQ